MCINVHEGLLNVTTVGSSVHQICYKWTYMFNMMLLQYTKFRIDNSIDIIADNGIIIEILDCMLLLTKLFLVLSNKCSGAKHLDTECELIYYLCVKYFLALGI